MVQKVVGDLVDLALHFFEPRDEIVDRRGAAQKAFPPGLLAADIQFADREAANCRDDVAQAVAGRADILVANVLKHRLADFLQFLLGSRAEGHDGIRVGHVDFGDPLFDLG